MYSAKKLFSGDDDDTVFAFIVEKEGGVAGAFAYSTGELLYTTQFCCRMQHEVRAQTSAAADRARVHGSTNERVPG